VTAAPVGTARIGATDVEVTRLALGTAPLGGWPTPVPDDQALATLRRAWEVGIRYVDTAPFYGTGKSETLVGEVLSTFPRDQFVLSTKVGRLLVPGKMEPEFFQGGLPFTPVYDYSAEGVEQSLQESYGRLGLNRVDIALIHDPDDHHAEALAGAYPALADAKADGRIRAIGVGMNWAEPLARFAEEAAFDCMLLAGRYTLLEQGSLDNLMPLAVDRGISIIVGGVFNSGLLADPSPGATYNYFEAEPAVLERAQRLEAVCREFDVPLRAAAVQFPLAHPAVACIVVGARSPEEVDDTVAMLRTAIPAELWETLRERELIHPAAPAPGGDPHPPARL
jgi:D-threo-aldose 1-dehydrogenase